MLHTVCYFTDDSIKNFGSLTRCFGDRSGMKAGISYIPEITVTVIKLDQIIVLGSHELWSALSNEYVHNVIKQHGLSFSNSCNYLIAECIKKCKVQHDITIVILGFQ